jgi:hypothetical protein
LSFIKDIHNDTASIVKPLLDSYEELGGKINRFINYVEKEWNYERPLNSKPVTANPCNLHQDSNRKFYLKPKL